MIEDSTDMTITNLEELVYHHLNKNKRIVKTKVTNLTAGGENYGSTVVKVDIVLEDECEFRESLSLFGKMIPPTELFRELFNIQVAFKLEASFYNVIVPTLQKFQRENGITDVIDFFPSLYGARMNLDGGETVDENAIILLENLKLSGFTNLDRHIGCNLDSAKFLLKNIAQFHAVPLALKIQRPEVFEKSVKCFMACFHPEPPEFDNSPAERNILDILSDRQSCATLLPKLERSFPFAFCLQKTFREPFATMVHRDLWVNNFMVKLDGGTVIKNKFVDFQAYSYNSPVRDLLFFLFTSVQAEVIQENLNDLLKFYHEYFINTLSDLGCCTDQFSYEKFMEEIDFFGKFEIGHIIYMLLFIVCGNKDIPATGGDPGLVPKDKISPDARERAWWILQEFENRKWLEF